MPSVFKYKHPCSYEYAPGYVNIGINGASGKRGPYGNAVYFTDFELDNSYNIELALQRIENNYVLSSLKIIQLKNREYMVNDIILSNGGNCYRLVKSSSESLFKNYKFDIEFLGKLHKSSFNNATSVTAYDFTGCEIWDADTDELLRTFPVQTFSPVPTNRVDDDFSTEFYKKTFGAPDYPYPDSAYAIKYFTLYGVWLKFVVFSNESDNVYYDASTGTLSGVKYTLTVQLNNTKTLQGNTGPGDNNGYNDYGDPTGVYDGETPAVMQTYIPMEFANLCVCNANVTTKTYKNKNVEIDVDDNTKQIFSELIWHKDSYPRKIPSYISDYSMDMLHPSGNNIKCTLDETRSMWRNSGKEHWSLNSKDTTYKECLGYRSYVMEGDVARESKYEENADPEHDYSDEISETICDNARDILMNSATDYTKLSSSITVDTFSEYSAGLGISAMNSDSMQERLDSGEFFNNGSHFIEGSKTSLGNKTTHPGESIFFSAISSDNPDNITDAIWNYIFSDNNIFTLTSKNNKTKECLSNELTVSLNTDFKNKRIYVKLDGENITAIKIMDKN